MLKSKSVALVLVLALCLSFSVSVLADEPVSLLPELNLSVQQSPLTVYPPIMVYTTQLSFVPPISSAQLKVDFYNIDSNSSTSLKYLGSAIVDNTGKAVLNKQMDPGKYTAIAKVIINNQTVTSNKVDYIVK